MWCSAGSLLWNVTHVGGIEALGHVADRTTAPFDSSPLRERELSDRGRARLWRCGSERDEAVFRDTHEEIVEDPRLVDRLVELLRPSRHVVRHGENERGRADWARASYVQGRAVGASACRDGREKIGLVVLLRECPVGEHLGGLTALS